MARPSERFGSFLEACPIRGPKAHFMRKSRYFSGLSFVVLVRVDMDAGSGVPLAFQTVSLAVHLWQCSLQRLVPNARTLRTSARPGG